VNVILLYPAAVASAVQYMYFSKLKKKNSGEDLFGAFFFFTDVVNLK
jgi:hypothetical protein